MSKSCHVCGKSVQVGNKVSHSNRKSRRVWHPNLQSVRILVGKVAKRVTLCTKCLKRGNIRKAA